MEIKEALRDLRIRLQSIAIHEIKRRRPAVSPLPPLQVFIETTAHCNLRYPICPVAGGPERSKGFMGWDLDIEIIDQIKGKVPQMSFATDGEPYDWTLPPHK